MDEDLLAETWLILKEYIKDKQQAADHLVGYLIDMGVDEASLIALKSADKYMASAVDDSGELDDFDEDFDFE